MAGKEKTAGELGIEAAQKRLAELKRDQKPKGWTQITWKKQAAGRLAGMVEVVPEGYYGDVLAVWKKKGVVDAKKCKAPEDGLAKAPHMPGEDKMVRDDGVMTTTK